MLCPGDARSGEHGPDALAVDGGSSVNFADQPLGTYLDDLASGTVPPGGGSAAAVGGATGAALCELVCNNTIGHADHAEVQAEMTEVRDELAANRARLMELAAEDSDAIEELMAAYGRPEGDGRDEAIQVASKRATTVPLGVAEACLDVIERAAMVTEMGNPNAAPDGAIGAFLADGALRAAAFTVGVNLPHVEDEDFVADAGRRVAEVGSAADAALDRVRENVTVD